MLNDQEIAKLLNDDIRLEHAAIVQYLQHAYILGEGELRTEIEEIAREEMYHLQWLSEAVAALKGEPVSERGELFLSAPLPADLMDINVRTEEGAIAQYLEHIEAIEKEEIRGLLKRILRDEREHEGEFVKLRAKAQNSALAFPVSEKAAGGDSLNRAFEGEYSQLLQYLRQSFLAKDCGMARRMSDMAIESMKHMGWLGERIVDLGGVPKPDSGAIARVDHSPGRAAMLDANRTKLEELRRDYEALKEEVDPESNHLLSRIQGNELYQAQSMERGPEFDAGSTPKSSSWTVGPLKK